MTSKRIPCKLKNGINHYGWIIDGKRWITDGKVLAIDPLWNWTDRRITEAFGAGKNWSFVHGTFSADDVQVAGGVDAILSRARQEEWPLMSITPVRFREYVAMIGPKDKRCLVREEYLPGMCSSFLYDAEHDVIVGLIGTEVVLVARGGREAFDSASPSERELRDRIMAALK